MEQPIPGALRRRRVASIAGVTHSPMLRLSWHPLSNNATWHARPPPWCRRRLHRDHQGPRPAPSDGPIWCRQEMEGLLRRLKEFDRVANSEC